jgi:hypothetical protein
MIQINSKYYSIEKMLSLYVYRKMGRRKSSRFSFMRIMDEYDGKRRGYTRRDVLIILNTTIIWIIVNINWTSAVLNDLTTIFSKNGEKKSAVSVIKSPENRRFLGDFDGMGIVIFHQNQVLPWSCRYWYMYRPYNEL